MRKIDKKALILLVLGYVASAIYIKLILDFDTSPLSFIFKSREDLFKIYTMLFFAWLLHYQVKPKKFMPGEEKGTARFGNKEDIKPVVDENEDNNVLFTQTEKMSLNTRMTRKNLNQLIIGGAGAGKTRFFIKPNIMQQNTSFVITDPKGEILRSTGKSLEKAGYKVRVFNLIDMIKSSNYNPLAYIKKDEDVLKLISNLIKNTNPDVATGGDPFWEKSETALLQALIFVILEEGLESEKNFPMVMELLQLADVKEEDENHISELDLLFQDLEERKPQHIAVKQYKLFKMAAGKTAKSILISVGVRLAPFSIENVKNLVSKDNMELEKIGIEKTALFILISDSDGTFNFLAAMMYTQLFNILFYVADFEHGGRLPIHVRCLLDEFANIGSIPDFEKLIATMRSREISVSIVLQNLAQIKSKYKESWETITGNCDSFLFLGGNEWDTLKYVSEMLGKQTIDIRTSGKTRGSQGSSSLNYQVDGRELFMPDELKLMPDSDCILFIRGIRPFKSKKIDLEKHKNFKELDDYNKDNAYDISKYKEKLLEGIRKEIFNNSIVINKTSEEISKTMLIGLFQNLELRLKDNYDFQDMKVRILSDIQDDKIKSKEEVLEIIREIGIHLLDEEFQKGEKLNIEQEIKNNSVVINSDSEKITKAVVFKWFEQAEKELENNVIFQELKADILNSIPERILTKEEFKNITKIVKEQLELNNLQELEYEEPELEDVI